MARSTNALYGELIGIPASHARSASTRAAGKTNEQDRDKPHMSANVTSGFPELQLVHIKMSMPRFCGRL